MLLPGWRTVDFAAAFVSALLDGGAGLPLSSLAAPNDKQSSAPKQRPLAVPKVMTK